MRILVTGGAGFLGSHLVDRLLSEGHEVVCLDNLSTGRAANVEHLEGRAGFTFLRADVVEPLPVSGPLDRLYHLAAPVSTTHHDPRPIEQLRCGAEGTRRCLELAAERGARLLLASTSEVYGEARVHPQTEDYAGYVDPVGPRSAYNESKRFAEALVTAYRRTRGADARIARIFNTYGPRMRSDDGRVVPNFVRQALAGGPLTIYGDGRQTRSFCYVSDMVEALVRLMESDEPGPVNLGNPQEVTVLELAREVIGLVGREAGLAMQPLPKDDPPRRCPDVTRARERLGWAPAVARDRGLALTIDYFRKEGQPG